MLKPKSLLQITAPPYFFRPMQILRRLKLEYFRSRERRALVTLPWGLRICIDPHEAVGYNIASRGLYECGVTETLWRLTEPEELAIDAGANIGYTASILGVRVGPKGKVVCFEPHPDVFETLKSNVGIWMKDARCGCFVLHHAALGVENGQASLHTYDWFNRNRGTAWVSNTMESASDRLVVEVPLRALDSLIDEGEKIGILKIDVEGGELGVLQGMARILGQRAVRDIVFEEEASFPAPTHRYLESKGYSIFGIQEEFLGVRCLPNAPPSAVFDAPANYLATVDPDRAISRLGPPLWRSFGPARFLSDLL